MVTKNKIHLFDDWYKEGSQVLYETDSVVAFIPSIVRVEGHLLVIPKARVDSMLKLRRRDFIALWEEVYRCVALVKKAYKCDGAVITQNEMLWKVEPRSKYHVKQVHVHVIPSHGNYKHVERKMLSAETIEEIKKKLAFLLPKSGI